jgi:hypothetical protein
MYPCRYRFYKKNIEKNSGFKIRVHKSELPVYKEQGTTLGLCRAFMHSFFIDCQPLRELRTLNRTRGTDKQKRVVGTGQKGYQTDSPCSFHLVLATATKLEKLHWSMVWTHGASVWVLSVTYDTPPPPGQKLVWGGGSYGSIWRMRIRSRGVPRWEPH